MDNQIIFALQFLMSLTVYALIAQQLAIALELELAN